MAQQGEQDFPPGHPARFDYDARSPEALEYARVHSARLGERDWPVDSPHAVDTHGNRNSVEWQAGVDPQHPELQPFTGRTPEQVRAIQDLNRQLSLAAADSPALKPVIAPPPPRGT